MQRWVGASFSFTSGFHSRLARILLLAAAVLIAGSLADASGPPARAQTPYARFQDRLYVLQPGASLSQALNRQQALADGLITPGAGFPVSLMIQR